MTELKVGGHKRLVIIPKGKVMRGWKGFDFERHTQKTNENLRWDAQAAVI